MKDDDIEELKEDLNRVKQREKALIKKQKKSLTNWKQPELLIKDIQDEEIMSDGEIFRVDRQESESFKQPTSSAASSLGNTFCYEPPTEYEDIIWKFENDIWNHIRSQN